MVYNNTIVKHNNIRKNNNLNLFIDDEKNNGRF